MNLSNIPIFNYVVAIQRKEYIVTIFDDGMSQWDDLAEGCLLDRVKEEKEQGPIVEARVGDEIFEKARYMAEREKAEEIRAGQGLSPTGETADDIAQMDGLLIEYFWREVNPVLTRPLTR